MKQVSSSEISTAQVTNVSPTTVVSNEAQGMPQPVPTLLRIR